MLLDPLFPVELHDLPADWQEMVKEREALLFVAGDPDPLDAAVASVLYSAGREDPAQIPAFEGRFGVAWSELEARFGAPPLDEIDKNKAPGG